MPQGKRKEITVSPRSFSDKLKAEQSAGTDSKVVEKTIHGKPRYFVVTIK